MIDDSTLTLPQAAPTKITLSPGVLLEKLNTTPHKHFGDDTNNEQATPDEALIISSLTTASVCFFVVIIILVRNMILRNRRQQQGEQFDQPAIHTISTPAFGASKSTYISLKGC